MNEVITNAAVALAESMAEDIVARRPDGSPGASVYWRDLSDGREITVFMLLFGEAKMGVGPLGASYTDAFYHFPTVAHAMAAALGWDGDSDPGSGWIRSSDGRRRRDGDPDQEYTPKD